MSRKQSYPRAAIMNVVGLDQFGKRLVKGLVGQLAGIDAELVGIMAKPRPVVMPEKGLSVTNCYRRENTMTINRRGRHRRYPGPRGLDHPPVVIDPCMHKGRTTLASLSTLKSTRMPAVNAAQSCPLASKRLPYFLWVYFSCSAATPLIPAFAKPSVSLRPAANNSSPLHRT